MNILTTQKVSYGVYAVTTWHEGKATGCIANAVMQVTAQPAIMAIGIHHDNFTNECIKKTGKFAVSIFAVDTDPSLIGTFGFKSGRDTDKFAGVEHKIFGNLPVITDSCGYIVCDVIDSAETPTHTVFFGKITDADTFGDRKPMTYAYYHEVIKGKSPAKAPTYVAETAAPQKKTRKFRCKVCGYEYEGDSLPADFVCPICGVGADEFEEVD